MRNRFKRLTFALFFFGFLGLTASAAPAIPDPSHWDEAPASAISLKMEPAREDALTSDHLRLALKHYPRPGAQPILLLHGLAQNDRMWDSVVRKYSFARFMHAQGFDVWIGNLRSAGTKGFKSETPVGPHHWTVDDYAIYDVPALVNRVRQQTGQRPYLIGHSLAAWAIEGYLAGLDYSLLGQVVARPLRGAKRQNEIQGVATIAGVYNLHWEKPLEDFRSNPIRNTVDYYHSNYELELLAANRPLFHFIPNLPALPLGWIGSVLTLPLNQLPWIGDILALLYEDFQNDVIQTPVLSMFYYPPNNDADNVRYHGQDGLEDLGPRLVEQLANAINDRQTSSYYHLDRPRKAYSYASIRNQINVPMLFVSGGRDRLAGAQQIYQDGYLATRAPDKQYLGVELLGHLDIVNGIHAPAEVMTPIAKWMREHQR